MRKLILIVALGLMTYGCDRIAYVAKKVTNGVANIYQKKLNRIPDAEGQWYVCTEKYADAPDARMICMIQMDGCAIRKGMRVRGPFPRSALMRI